MSSPHNQLASPPRVAASPTRELTTPTRMIRILGDSPLPAYDTWRLPVGTGGNYGDDSAYVAYGSHIAPWRTPVTDRPRTCEVFGFDCVTLLKRAKLMNQQALYFDDLDAQVAAYFYVEVATVQHKMNELREKSQRAYDWLIASPGDVADDVIEGDINEMTYDLKQIAHHNLRNLNNVYRKDVFKSLREEERDLERQRYALFNRVLASEKLRTPRPSRIPVRKQSILPPPPELDRTISSSSPKITFAPSPPPKSASKIPLPPPELNRTLRSPSSKPSKIPVRLSSSPGWKSKPTAQRPVGRPVQVAGNSSRRDTKSGPRLASRPPSGAKQQGSRPSTSGGHQQASRPNRSVGGRPASQPNVGVARSQQQQQQQPHLPSRPYTSTLQRPPGSHLPLYSGHVGGRPKPPRPENQRPRVPLKTKYQRMAKWIKCTEEAARALDEESYLEHHQEQTTSRFEDEDLPSDLVDLHNMLLG